MTTPEPFGEGGLVGLALRAVRTGTSANVWAQQLRESGAGIRRQVALRIYSQARVLAAEYGAEPTRPLDRAPTSDELRQWPTRSTGGVLQTVSLYYREKVTGNIVQRFYNVKSDQPLTRQEAVNKAIDSYALNAIRYQQDLIGAFHTGTALLVPQEAA